MKSFKKFSAALLATIMIACAAVPALAADPVALVATPGVSASDSPTPSSTDVKPVTPSDVKPVTPTDVKPVTPTDVKPVTPTDVKPVTPTDVKPVTPTDVKPVTPTDVKPVTPTDVTPTEGGKIERFYGGDRYATANSIVTNGWKKADVVVIASGEAYPDALAGATVAKKLGAPILLTGKNVINPMTQDLIQQLGAKKVVILGGTAAVSEEIEKKLKADGSEIERIAGENRNDTAAKVAAKLTAKSDVVFLVNNAHFADALAVSSVAAIEGAPILYVNPNGTLPTETTNAIKALGAKNAYIIGGPAAIKEDAEKALEALGLKAERVYGADRYATSDAVFTKFAKDFSGKGVCIATGKNFPDALAGAAYAAANNMPVMLIGDELTEAMKANELNNITIFGGPNAVSEELSGQMKRALQ